MPTSAVVNTHYRSKLDAALEELISSSLLLSADATPSPKHAASPPSATNRHASAKAAYIRPVPLEALAQRSSSSPSEQQQQATTPLARIMHASRQWITEQEQDFSRYARLMSIPEVIDDPTLFQQHTLGAGGSLAGDEVVRQMRADADALVPPPTDFQRTIIEFMIELMAPCIYGDAWKTDRVSIRLRNNWTEEHHGIGAILSGRKEGKSTGLAMAIAIAVMNIRNADVALFSRTLTQSCIILNMTKTILYNHPRAANFKIATNKTTIQLFVALGDTRKIQAWTGSADACGCGWLVGVLSSSSSFSFLFTYSNGVAAAARYDGVVALRANLCHHQT